MTKNSDVSDTYALTVCTQHLFPKTSFKDLMYSTARFGLKGTFELSRAANIHPEKELTDIISYFRDSMVGKRLDDTYSICYIKTVLDQQEVPLPNEMFSLMDCYDMEWIVCEEERNRVPSYLDKLFSRVRSQEQAINNLLASLPSPTNRKQLTYQKPQTIDETIEQLQARSGCTREEASTFCEYVPANTTEIYYVLSQEEFSEEKKSMKEILTLMREQRNTRTCSPPKKMFMCEQTITYLQDQGLSEEHAQKFVNTFREKAIPVYRTLEDAGGDPEDLLMRAQNNLLAQQPLEDIESFIRKQTKERYKQ